MEKNIPGYGDRDCRDCKIIRNPEMLALCQAMVGYTRLQEEAARNQEWGTAIFWENKQNRIAGQLGCLPGGYKM